MWKEACLLLPQLRRGGIQVEGEQRRRGRRGGVEEPRQRGIKSRCVLTALAGGGAALSVVLEHTADQLVRSRGGTLHFARCASVFSARLLAR